MKKRLKPTTKLTPFGGIKRAYTTDRAFNAPTTPTNKTAHVIYQALENPQFKWRTIKGLAKETGVDHPTVQRVIKKLGEQVVKSSQPSTSGDELFTTRRHYRETESFISRIGAILRNRAT